MPCQKADEFETRMECGDRFKSIESILYNAIDDAKGYVHMLNALNPRYHRVPVPTGQLRA
jgi:hypothetical protein